MVTVTLYEQDAVVVRDGMIGLAEYVRKQDSASLGAWIDAIEANLEKSAAPDTHHRGNLAAARSTSIACEINEQLPTGRQVGLEPPTDAR